MIKMRPYSQFFLLCVLAVVLGWRVLVSTFALASGNDSYTHILLILPFAVALMLMDRHDSGWNSVGSPRAGCVLLFTGIVIGCCAALLSVPSDVRLAIGMLAIVTWWVGAFVFCFGIGVAKREIFPLCFLFWLVPFPNILLDAVIALLQQGSALCARLLFDLVRVPVVQEGLRVSIPGLTVEVAVECSSIRSSLMLVVTTMVLAQLLLRSPWSKALLVALAVPLSVAKNGLRIFTIAMLGTRVDAGYLNGKLHHHGGALFFAIALMVVFATIYLLRRVESKGTAPSALDQALASLSI